MRPIPKKHREIISSDPYFRVCARRNHDCDGRITIEHAWIYGGKQINELWAYVPLCEFHHLRKGLNKEINHYLSIKRASDDDLKKYPRKNWNQEKAYLYNKYANSDTN